jgi:hypothetical protein
MPNEYMERVNQIREEERDVDDARNYSGNVIDVPDDYDAEADLEHRLGYPGEAGTVISYADPWASNSDWDRHIVVGEDGIDRIFVVNRDTGETLNVTDHPNHEPSEAEDARIAEDIDSHKKLAEVDDMMEESVQELVEEEGMSLAEVIKAAKRKSQEGSEEEEEEEEDGGPKKLSPSRVRLQVEERMGPNVQPWEREGWGAEDPVDRPQDAPMTEEGQKRLGFHPSQQVVLSAVDVDATRERFEEPRPQYLRDRQGIAIGLTKGQREMARKVFGIETADADREFTGGQERSWFGSEETRYATPTAEADTAVDWDRWQEATEKDTGLKESVDAWNSERPAYIEKRSGYSIPPKKP